MTAEIGFEWSQDNKFEERIDKTYEMPRIVLKLAFWFVYVGGNITYSIKYPKQNQFQMK